MPAFLRPTYLLATNLFYLDKNYSSQNDHSNGPVKKPPHSQQTFQNQLIQNDGVVLLTLVQIGYF
jgi:hypothetical protein